MSDYLDYLNQISSAKSFSRKIDYIKYNFKKYLDFEDPKNVKILEIGSGLGETVKLLNNMGYTLIDVIDNDESILTHIRSTFKVARTFKTDDLTEIDNELDYYDSIIATQLLEHIPKDQYVSFLTTLFSHLKKGGHIIVTVPNMANPFTLFERYGDITHTNGFTDSSLKELALICRIPDSAVRIVAFNIPTYSLINIVRRVMQKVLHLVILSLSIINGGGYSKLLTPNISLIIRK